MNRKEKHGKQILKYVSDNDMPFFTCKKLSKKTKLTSEEVGSGLRYSQKLGKIKKWNKRSWVRCKNV